MGHESPIELWSPNLTTFCFVGFGTDRLRRQEAMKTADRENPTHGVTWPRNRAHGAVGQNRTSSIEWAEKQEKFQPRERCFFLTSPFIELIGTYPRSRTESMLLSLVLLHPGGSKNRWSQHLHSIFRHQLLHRAFILFVHRHAPNLFKKLLK